MVFRARPHFLGFLFARLLDSGFGQIANDRVHIASDITYLCEFGCFYLNERRIGEFRRRPTLLFNGYADQVSRLYAGMDLRKSF